MLSINPKHVLSLNCCASTGTYIQVQAITLTCVLQDLFKKQVMQMYIRILGQNQTSQNFNIILI